MNIEDIEVGYWYKCKGHMYNYNVKITRKGDKHGAWHWIEENENKLFEKYTKHWGLLDFSNIEYKYGDKMQNLLNLRMVQ